mgnify:FL=1
MEASSSASKRQDVSRLFGTVRTNHTPARSYEKGGLGFRTSETSQKSTGKRLNGPTSSVVASRARTSAPPERERASRESVPVFGRRCSKPLGFYDHDTRSWRTFQRLLFEDLTSSLQALPKQGMMRSGLIYGLRTLERPIVGSDSSSSHIPTPTVADTFTGGLKSSQQKEGSLHSVNLSQYAVRFPTPAARDYKDNNSPAESQRHSPSMASIVGGKLNPEWVEWLIGLPQEWTALSGENASRLWEMVSSRKSRSGLE